MFRKRKKLEVLCIGSTSVDLFFPTDEGVIIETPEDVTSQKKLAFELGGKVGVPVLYTAIGGVAANVARGLSQLNVTAAVYSCIGNDTNGTFCLSTLRQSGVNTDYLRVLPEAKTDLSAIIVHTPTGDRTIFHNRHANNNLKIVTEKLQTPWIFISSLNGAWQENIAVLLRVKKERGFKIALNPGQHNIKEDSALVWQVIRETTLLILNKDEAIELVLHKKPNSLPTELDTEQYLMDALLEGGAKVVALTDGVRGAWVSSKQESWYLSVPKSTVVVDATGAGDAFTSGFLGGTILGKTLDECLRIGMANSQKVIQVYGASECLLSAQELEAAIVHLIPQKLR